MTFDFNFYRVFWFCGKGAIKGLFTMCFDPNVVKDRANYLDRPTRPPLLSTVDFNLFKDWNWKQKRQFWLKRLRVKIEGKKDSLAQKAYWRKDYRLQRIVIKVFFYNTIPPTIKGWARTRASEHAKGPKDEKINDPKKRPYRYDFGKFGNLDVRTLKIASLKRQSNFTKKGVFCNVK